MKSDDLFSRIDRLERLVYALGMDACFNGNNAGVNPDEYLLVENGSIEIELRLLQQQIKINDFKEPDTMSKQTAPDAPQKQNPVCPYCEADPFDVAIHGPSQAGPFQMMAMACANPQCRKVFSIQVLGVVPQGNIVAPHPPLGNPLFPR